WHRRRHRFDQRCTDRLSALVPATAARELPRAERLAAHGAVAGLAPEALQARAPRGDRATYRTLHGTERRAHGEAVADPARRAGSARLRHPCEGRGRLGGGLLR